MYFIEIFDNETGESKVVEYATLKIAREWYKMINRSSRYSVRTCSAGIITGEV